MGNSCLSRSINVAINPKRSLPKVYLIRCCQKLVELPSFKQALKNDPFTGHPNRCHKTTDPIFLDSRSLIGRFWSFPSSSNQCLLALPARALSWNFESRTLRMENERVIHPISQNMLVGFACMRLEILNNSFLCWDKQKWPLSQTANITSSTCDSRHRADIIPRSQYAVLTACLRTGLENQIYYQ